VNLWVSVAYHLCRCSMQVWCSCSRAHCRMGVCHPTWCLFKEGVADALMVKKMPAVQCTRVGEGWGSPT
jgi:hypothetical protein